jgi:DNA-binding IclR family transcriptional regulator
MGTAFVAWASDAGREAWLSRLEKAAAEDARPALQETLDAVRRVGYSVARGHRWHSEAAEVLTREQPDQHGDDTTEQLHRLIRSLPPDYENPDVAADDVRTVNTPVFGPGGGVVLVLSVTVAGRRSLTADLAWTVERLRTAADAVTKSLEGTGGQMTESP